MPDFLQTGSKLKIIEYGKNEGVEDILQDIKDGLLNLMKE